MTRSTYARKADPRDDDLARVRGIGPGEMGQRVCGRSMHDLTLAAEGRTVTRKSKRLASVLNWTEQPRWEQLIAKMFSAPLTAFTA